MMRFSSIEKKALMAATGLVLIGFVIGHLAGNLLIFFGPSAINGYARHLEEWWFFAWTVRSILIAAFLLHVLMAVWLSLDNRAARPVGYAMKQSLRTTYAARTMMVSGVLLTVFIAYHLLHFTFRVTHPAISHLTDAEGRRNVYAMVVLSFQDPYLVIGYVASMGLLCAHLSHGLGSFLQSLGLNNERLLPVLTRTGRLLAWALFIGYAAIPTSILLGWLK